MRSSWLALFVAGEGEVVPPLLPEAVVAGEAMLATELGVPPPHAARLIATPAVVAMTTGDDPDPRSLHPRPPPTAARTQFYG